MPRLPLQIEMSDPELSQIRSWRVPVDAANQRLAMLLFQGITFDLGFIVLLKHIVTFKTLQNLRTLEMEV